MLSILSRPVTKVWGLLVLLTLASLSVGHFGIGGHLANVPILAAAFAKGHWMLLDFLKLRQAPSGWRMAFHVWLALVTATAGIAAAVPLLQV